MSILPRLVAAASRLLRGTRPRRSAGDSLGVVLAATAETGSVVTIPGLLHWLGREQAPDASDFRASIDGGFTESYEAFCERISRTEASA